MRICYNTCDHCGKQLNEMTDFVDIELKTMVIRRVDLCSKCCKELDVAIGEFLREDLENCDEIH